ncbi:MAG: hypothetical protein JWO93_2319 [Micrococcaceae bacterium]|nr:hypothetical protein [Micrococcaceae bacterium]
MPLSSGPDGSPEAASRATRVPHAWGASTAGNTVQPLGQYRRLPLDTARNYGKNYVH